MATQACSTCHGKGLNPYTNLSSLCPMCEGSGQQFDPGREFTYEMGPFILNAPAAIAPPVPQYFAGAASATSILNGVTCQVANYRFRWMFGVKVSTFPFTIQLTDAGSGSGRSFCPQQIQVHSDNLFGTARQPMPLPTPYVFNFNQNITANFTDLGGAVGTAGVTNGSPTVTWVSGASGGFNTTPWPSGYLTPNTPMWNGATINLGGVLYVISAVTSQGQLTLAQNYAGATNAGIAFAVPNTIRVGFKGVELSS